MDTEKSLPPPNCGKRLLPTLIDQIAQENAERIFCVVPKSLNPEDGVRDVSYRDLAQAINRCSWWIRQELGEGVDFATIAYLGPLDLMYHILTIAAIKTGFKVKGRI